MGNRRGVAVLLAGCALVMLGCTQKQESTSRNPGGPPTSVLPVQAANPSTPTDVAMGQTITTAQGNTVTIHAYVPAAAYAEAGVAIAAADVEACAAAHPSTTTGGVVVKAGTSPSFFRLQLSDGSVVEAMPQGTKQPALGQEVLAPGSCKRAWVSFRVPESKTGAYVVLQSLSSVRWRIA